MGYFWIFPRFLLLFPNLLPFLRSTQCNTYSKPVAWLFLLFTILILLEEYQEISNNSQGSNDKIEETDWMLKQIS